MMAINILNCTVEQSSIKVKFEDVRKVNEIYDGVRIINIWAPQFGSFGTPTQDKRIRTHSCDQSYILICETFHNSLKLLLEFSKIFITLVIGCPIIALVVCLLGSFNPY